MKEKSTLFTMRRGRMYIPAQQTWRQILEDEGRG